MEGNVALSITSMLIKKNKGMIVYSDKNKNLTHNIFRQITKAMLWHAKSHY